MKKNDLLILLLAALIFVPFFVSDPLYQFYKQMNEAHYFILAFLKFGVLATLGECIGLRIKSGSYYEKGFGVMPRAIVWGLLGVWIASAMKVFAGGVPGLIESFGVPGVKAAMTGDLTWLKVLGALGISTMMNTIFAPVFMTIHKVTDTHILANGGRFSSLLHPIPFGKILSGLNWGVMWGFVFKKTIPFFWIPAHTVTFMLPAHLQVLSAALLGVALGIILSIAAVKSRD